MYEYFVTGGHSLPSLFSVLEMLLLYLCLALGLKHMGHWAGDVSPLHSSSESTSSCTLRQGDRGLRGEVCFHCSFSELCPAPGAPCGIKWVTSGVVDADPEYKG